MNWSMFLKRGNPSAPVACERLQILLAHERSDIGPSNLIPTLREEILAAISRHVAVEADKVQVRMGRGPVISTLEIEVGIPNLAEVSQLAASA